ncbi:MAG: hypothetical protein WC304_03175 [Candidatus Gracilibacteria bacterium]|jgi:hypothetical protein
MLLLPHSIAIHELEPIGDFFPISTIIKAAKKVKQGLGNPLASAPANSRLVKIYLTSKQAAGRSVFLVQLNSGYIIPVLVRLKKDSVGKNITPKNPAFRAALEKNFELIKKDLAKGDFDLFPLE